LQNLFNVDMGPKDLQLVLNNAADALQVQGRWAGEWLWGAFTMERVRKLVKILSTGIGRNGSVECGRRSE
jgi:hypothetical protein